MKTSISIILVATFLLGCSTLKAPVAEVPASKLSPGKYELSHVSVKNHPEVEELFNQALAASRDQEWGRLIDLLEEIDLKSGPMKPGTVSTSFAWLQKLTESPFPGEKAVDALLRLVSQRYPWHELQDNYQTLRRLYKESPFSLEWTGEESVLEWRSPSWWSLSERLGYSLRFHPIVEVKINGVSLRMVLDTGASVTYVYADSALKVGLQNYPDLKENLEDSQGRVDSAQVGLAKTLVIGNLKAKNVLVRSSPRPFGGDGFDGLIGWPILSQLVMEMDPRAQKITLRPSRGEKGPNPNYFWIGEPLIGLQSEKGEDLMFFLDTGASKPQFTEQTLKSLGARYRPDGEGFDGGLHGVAGSPRIKVDEVRLHLDGTPLVFKDLRTGTQVPFHHFTWWAGLLGSDMAQAGVFTLDFPSARASFRPYQF